MHLETPRPISSTRSTLATSFTWRSSRIVPRILTEFPGKKPHCNLSPSAIIWNECIGRWVDNRGFVPTNGSFGRERKKKTTTWRCENEATGPFLKASKFCSLFWIGFTRALPGMGFFFLVIYEAINLFTARN